MPLSIKLRKVYRGPLGGVFHLTSNGLLPCSHCEIFRTMEDTSKERRTNQRDQSTSYKSESTSSVNLECLWAILRRVCLVARCSEKKTGLPTQICSAGWMKSKGPFSVTSDMRFGDIDQPTMNKGCWLRLVPACGNHCQIQLVSRPKEMLHEILAARNPRCIRRLFPREFQCVLHTFK